MITFTSGDILKSGAEALVNTVNCVGVMGRGVALQFKNAFQDNYEAYARACEAQEVQPGRMFVYERHRLDTPRFIINFPTKRHWRGKSRMEDIDAGLIDLVRVIRERKIRSIAIPPLGSGLGGLDWRQVRPRIEQALEAVPDVEVIVYEPGGAPAADAMSRARAAPAMSPGRAALVGLVDRYLNGLLDPFVSLLEVHKLMYFMQEAGEPLKLRYAQAFYGPYAENLRHVLREVESHYLSGYADGGDAPTKRLELVPGAVVDAQAKLKDAPETQARFERVTDLVGGFESPFGLELLATVHWVATRLDAGSADAAVSETYAWGERKRQFSPEQVRLAYDVLQDKGWLASRPLAA
ncbi:type II toxin-antitoxin system antitoxin DNA ADP-ribosyl glycohydrolase DarG [Brevundimonas sp.]|uniref:type II toxin-antitoxin system antitoxin DNA ADP-ribosyl glycohydrolase DarG n=1 Tax=Brevundimonas sp. TaxID=1871086 RepID=UPI003F71D5DA